MRDGPAGFPRTSPVRIIPTFIGFDPYEPSLPGLTRQSIFLKRRCFSEMDTRVKPAYDKSLIAMAGIS